MRHAFCRIPAVFAALAATLAPAFAQQPRTEAAQRIKIQAQAIQTFDAREPQRTLFGALSFRGGLVLESTARGFGGLSGLHVEPDGARFLAVGDRGSWFRGRIVYRGKTPIAITDAEIAPILGANGRPLARRGWYDTEALAVEGNIAYVGIERVQEIVRFDIGRQGLRARGQPIPVPAGVKTLPYNRSIECLAAAPKGALKGAEHAGHLLLVSEQGLDARGNLLGFVIGGAGATFAIKRSDDFDVSDCAIAPGNRLLLLERRFSWTRGVAMRIRSLPLAAIEPGALLDGPELIFADMATQIDNMEGLAVHRDPSGAVVLTLVSDDNFSVLQRTLLLQFTLAE